MPDREELDRLMKDKADCDFIEEVEDEDGTYRIYRNEELDKVVAFYIDDLDDDSARRLVQTLVSELKDYKVKED